MKHQPNTDEKKNSIPTHKYETHKNTITFNRSMFRIRNDANAVIIIHTGYVCNI